MNDKGKQQVKEEEKGAVRDGERVKRRNQQPHTITQKCPLGVKSIKGIENERNGSQSAEGREGPGETHCELRAATASHLMLTWELVLEVLGLLTHNEQATATATATASASSVPCLSVCLPLPLSRRLFDCLVSCLISRLKRCLC